MPYDLIDKIIEDQKAAWEENRKQALSHVKALLAEFGRKYGFSHAYIFGSTVKTGKFRPESDVDIAIFDLDTQYFFRVIAEMSRRLERDVDLYQMETVDKGLRTKIEQEGILWKLSG